MMNIRRFIANIILESLKESDSTFKPISNIKAFNYLRPRKYSEEIGRELSKEFLGKNGKRYYISKDINSPNFRVFDADHLDNKLDGKSTSTLSPVGYATFDTTPKGFFTGYNENESIHVKQSDRRNGVATAIIDFAEDTLGKSYKPADLLSKDMKAFASALNEIFLRKKVFRGGSEIGKYHPKATYYTDSEFAAKEYAKNLHGNNKIFAKNLSFKNPLILVKSEIGHESLHQLLSYIFGPDNGPDVYNFPFSLNGKMRKKIIDFALENGYDGIIMDDTDFYEQGVMRSYIELR